MRSFFHLFVRFFRFKKSHWEVFLENRCSRSSSPEVFLWKGVLKIRSKFMGEHPWWSVISIRLLCFFIEITLHYGCSPVSWLHIFRTHFHRKIPEGLLLVLPNLKRDNLNQILEWYLWRGLYLVKLQALKNELLLNTYFKEHLWWAVYEDFLYYAFYISIHVKIIQSLNYCPHHLMFRSMKNWNISLIVEYMKILRKSTCFAADNQEVWKETSDALAGRSLLLAIGWV